MAKGNTCEVCGGTETKLVDGFYYCVECGTQDTNVLETLVESTKLADGGGAIATKTKFSVKIKEGVEMSPEWYKWHTYNFMLAGLTEQLIQLGAEPGVKMKVLWIWTRYMRKYLKKEEFGRTQDVREIGGQAESEDAEPAPDAEEEGAKFYFRVWRVSRLLLAAVLAVALNLHRSALSLARFRRLVLHGLLPLNEAQRFVPADIDTRKVDDFRLFMTLPVTHCYYLEEAAGRLARRLRLGAWRTPAPEATLAELLRELCLPRTLAALVRALVRLAPADGARSPRRRQRAAPAPRLPAYEVTLAAYVLVALKLCFGLDDDYERRLSDEVERRNAAEGRARAHAGRAAPPGPRRLFSYRQWMAHVCFRQVALSEACAPLAHERNQRAPDYAVMEQCDEFTSRVYGARHRRTAAPRLGDRVTMDLLAAIPPRAPAAALPDAALRARLGAAAPLAALAEAVAPRLPPRARDLVAEDFTAYSVDYALRTLALPAAATGRNLVVGVGEAGKTFVDRLGDDIVRRYDPGTVYVRNCENKHWARTRRPRSFHVVEAEDGAGEAAPGERPADADADADAGAAVEPETFEEEVEGGNIFDDDFLDIEIKEEKETADTPLRDEHDDTKDNLNLNDFGPYENFDGWSPAKYENGSSDTDRDSDEEPVPRYDPATFDRAETIKSIMVAAYEELKVRPPIRFGTRYKKNYNKRIRDLEPGATPPPKRPRYISWEKKKARDDSVARVQEIVSAYYGSLQRDALHQLSQQVLAAVAGAAEPAPAAEPDGLEASSNGPRDVEVIENNADKSEDESSDGPAEDPVYKGDVKFDESTHDARQLYVKLSGSRPAAAAADSDSDSDADGRGGSDDEDVAGLLDDILTRDGAANDAGSKMKKEEKRSERRFPLLADDPDNITEFKYWFKHYQLGFYDERLLALEREIEETFPRSFRFALREAAHVVRVLPVTLYARVMDAEARLLRRLGLRLRGPRRRRRARGPRPRPPPTTAGGNVPPRNRAQEPEDPPMNISRQKKRPPRPPRDPNAPRRKHRRTRPLSTVTGDEKVPPRNRAEESEDPPIDISREKKRPPRPPRDPNAPCRKHRRTRPLPTATGDEKFPPRNRAEESEDPPIDISREKKRLPRPPRDPDAPRRKHRRTRPLPTATEDEKVPPLRRAEESEDPRMAVSRADAAPHASCERGRGLARRSGRRTRSQASICKI